MQKHEYLSLVLKYNELVSKNDDLRDDVWRQSIDSIIAELEGHVKRAKLALAMRRNACNKLRCAMPGNIDQVNDALATMAQALKDRNTIEVQIVESAYMANFSKNAIIKNEIKGLAKCLILLAAICSTAIISSHLAVGLLIGFCLGSEMHARAAKKNSDNIKVCL